MSKFNIERCPVCHVTMVVSHGHDELCPYRDLDQAHVNLIVSTVEVYRAWFIAHEETNHEWNDVLEYGLIRALKRCLFERSYFPSREEFNFLLSEESALQFQHAYEDNNVPPVMEWINIFCQ